MASTWRKIFLLAAVLCIGGGGPVWGVERPAAYLTSGGHVVGFYPDRLVLAARDHAVTVAFAGARPVIPTAEKTSPPEFARNDSKVVYSSLWRDIDLVYEKTAQGVIKSTYRISPGGDPEAIRLRYTQPVLINDRGELIVHYGHGEWREAPPIAWEEADGRSAPVSVSYQQLGDREIGFSVSGWKGDTRLVIDPVATWNTFLGSSYGEYKDLVNGIAVDLNGFVYVTGTSQYDWGSPSPVINPFPGQWNSNAFVAKLDGTLGLLIWTTFLGSPNGEDSGSGIAVDGSGYIYVTGASDASWEDNPARAHSGGGSEAYIAKLAADSGRLQKHTFLGAKEREDSGQGILIKNGMVYVVGKSNGSWLSAPEPVRSYSGAGDVFVARLNDVDLNLQWYTFLGSFDAEDARPALAVDGGGNVYVAGTSASTWGAPRRPHSPTGRDAFAAKLNGSGELQWNTFLGSGGQFYGQGIGVDGAGNVFIAGYGDGDWTEQPLQNYNGQGDAFVAKLDNSGYYQWHTFLGSAYDDKAWGLTLDNAGDILLVGESSYGWGEPLNPFTPPFIGEPGSVNDIFVAKLRGTGEMIWNTFLGSSEFDIGYGLAVDADKNVYVTGKSNFPWGSPVRNYMGDYDAIAAKLSYRTISGTVTYGGFPLGGVSIGLSTGGGTETNSNGFYQITVPDGWSGTVIPTLYPYIFTPASQGFTSLGNDVLLNFTSVEDIKFISGYILEGGAPVAGVTVTANSFDPGTPPVQTVTDGGGQYHISVHSGWTGTVTPGQPGYVFSPAAHTYSTPITSDLNGENFGATWQVYISGTVSQGGIGLAGVKLNGLPGVPVPETLADGSYRVRVRHNWTGTVTPAADNKLFSTTAVPPFVDYRSYVNVTSEQSGQNYYGRPAYVVSGHIRQGGVSLVGVTVTASPGGTTTTDGNGYYKFTLDTGWDGTVTPGHPSYTFTPPNWSTGNLHSNETVDFAASWAVYVSGSIKKGNGTGVPGVLLSGLPGTPAYTDGSGGYLAQASYSWSGYIVPVLDYYRFVPEYKAYNNIIGMQSAQDYLAIPVFYISGFIKEGPAPVAGVTVTAGSGESTTTDGNGFFRLAVDEGWSGTVTPFRNGYTFTPASRTYDPVTGDWSNQDFNAVWLVYITGSITAGGAGLGGVHLNGLPGDQHTQPDGSYRIRVDYNWYGTVTPALVGYIFNPTQISYPYTTAEQTGQNYEATAVPTRRLSGRVRGNGTGLAGVILTVNPGEPAVTDGSGQYEVIVNEGWSGSVTPTANGYTFLPSSRIYNNLASDFTAQDFISGSILYLPMIMRP